jgi:hypothetical protein
MFVLVPSIGQAEKKHIGSQAEFGTDPQMENQEHRQAI